MTEFLDYNGLQLLVGKLRNYTYNNYYLRGNTDIYKTYIINCEPYYKIWDEQYSSYINYITTDKTSEEVCLAINNAYIPVYRFRYQNGAAYVTGIGFTSGQTSGSYAVEGLYINGSFDIYGLYSTIFMHFGSYILDKYDNDVIADYDTTMSIALEKLAPFKIRNAEIKNGNFFNIYIGDGTINNVTLDSNTLDNSGIITSDATEDSHGLMPTEDKIYIDNLRNNFQTGTDYQIYTYSGLMKLSELISSETYAVSVVSSDKYDININIAYATTYHAGLMSYQDKALLDSIELTTYSDVLEWLS